MADVMTEHLRDLSRQAGEALQSVVRRLRSLKDSLLGDRKGGANWLHFRGFFGKRR